MYIKRWCLTCIALLSCLGILSAQSLLEELPVLEHSAYTYKQSTYDRTGKNSDFCNGANPNFYGFYYHGQVNNPTGTTNGTKELVLCHVKGPCKVERFWLISIPLNFAQHIRFYFDGETTPRVDKTYFQFFLEQLSPFNQPLVQQYKASSGGLWSYIPMTVQKDLIITIDSSLTFSHVDIRQLAQDSVISSYTPTSDNSGLIAELNKAGIYPKSNASAVTKDSQTIQLSPHQLKTLLLKNEAGVIQSVNMKIAEIDYSNNSYIRDEGRFHKGTSKATYKINGSANVVKLILRSIKSNRLQMQNLQNINTKAIVGVDNFPVGFWQLYKYRDYRLWQNDTLTIPKILYLNKNKITISVAYSSGEAWNEYSYRIMCDGVITDSVDVGNTISETAHAYSITNQYADFFTNLFADYTGRYVSADAIVSTNTTILDSIFIHFYFDGETQASISAPLGLFFATGTHDIADVQSLFAGHLNREFYNYLTMPYWQQVRIDLENRSSHNFNNIWTSIGVSTNQYDKTKTGYLKGEFKEQNKSFTDATDAHFAHFEGQGKYLGTVIQAKQNSDTTLAWLEGDEHIYTDDAQTPFHIGTGTEDYFNSTFYFMKDEYSLQQNGMTNSENHFGRCMYRFHILDPVPFEKNLSFQLEHGDYNDKQAFYKSLTWAYIRPSSLQITDSLDIGNLTSELLHQYTTSAQKVALNLNNRFEGENYFLYLQKNGYAIPDSSVFQVSILPENMGVRLLRTFDYVLADQYAEVWVDNQKAGEWFTAGKNDTCRFRDAIFDIPAALTRNKQSLQIKIKNKNSTQKWTELDYKIYTKTDTSTITSIKNNTLPEIKIYPTLTNGKIWINAKQYDFDKILVTEINGKVLKQMSSNINQIEIGDLPNGYYFISIVADNKILSTQKIVLVH